MPSAPFRANSGRRRVGRDAPLDLLPHIMLPQMWIESLPALVNEMSFLIKGSPAIAVIGVVELTRVTNRISSVTYEPLSPILAAGLLYGDHRLFVEAAGYRGT